MEEKQKIGKFAASLIEPDDFVYLDAGTTTGAMIPYIEETRATFVTNAVSPCFDARSKRNTRNFNWRRNESGNRSDCGK